MCWMLWRKILELSERAWPLWPLFLALHGDITNQSTRPLTAARDFRVMVQKQNLMMKILSAIPTILITYVAFSVYKLIYVLLYPSTDKSVYLYGSIALINCLVSYGAYRKNIIASWLMIIFLFLTGLAGLLLGVFMVPLSQIILKAVFIVLGVYFAFGSYKLYCYRFKGSN